MSLSKGATHRGARQWPDLFLYLCWKLLRDLPFDLRFDLLMY